MARPLRIEYEGAWYHVINRGASSQKFFHNDCQRELFLEVAKETGRLKNIRGIGGVIAGDLIVEDDTRRLGHQVFQRAKALGALLRPLGNTIYWLPPLNISEETLKELKEIISRSILES